tara:strand:+ start:80 stop:460 length:381 start_codon:yes stop_codon:yes gene_type:complete
MQQENYKKDFKKDGYKKDFKKDFKKRPFEKRHTRADFYISGNPDGVKVPDGKPGTLEKALKYLKRQMKDSDILFKYREKAYYEKPNQVRKVKMERAKAMQHKYDAMQKRKYNKHSCWLVMTKNGAE